MLVYRPWSGKVNKRTKEKKNISIFFASSNDWDKNSNEAKKIVGQFKDNAENVIHVDKKKDKYTGESNAFKLDI